MADKQPSQLPNAASAGPSFQGMPQFPFPYPQPQYGAPAYAAQPGQGLSPAHAEQLRGFWQEQLREVHQVPCDPAEFKNHQLPLARIKKIMKSDEDVRMISAEAPVLFAKACEMFILELTLRSWYHAEENKRRTLQRNDIAAAITKTDIFDFLIDIVPREDIKPEGQEGGFPAGPSGAAGSAAGAAAGMPPGMPPSMPPGMFGFPYMPPPGAPPGTPGLPPMDPSQMMAYTQQYMQGMQQMAGQGWPGAPPGLPGAPGGTNSQQGQPSNDAS